jgi:predicted kinase
MDNSFLLIITGPPGAGKTNLGRYLSRELKLPFISKDDIKDILFETLGWKDRQWSMKLGQASFEILFHQLEQQIKVHQSAIVETAFIPKYHNTRFLDLKSRYNFEIVQIVCNAEVEVLYERFIQRTASKQRHPGHVDHLTTYDQFTNMVSEGKYGVLDIGGGVLEIDTTDYNKLEYKSLINTIIDYFKFTPAM